MFFLVKVTRIFLDERINVEPGKIKSEISQCFSLFLSFFFFYRIAVNYALYIFRVEF